VDFDDLVAVPRLQDPAVLLVVLPRADDLAVEGGLDVLRGLAGIVEQRLHQLAGG